MRVILTLAALAVMLTTVGCGSDEAAPEEPMKVEETVFGDLVGTQDKARDGANAAVETHREALERRLDADEGAPPEE